jgi:hypothetical protein
MIAELENKSHLEAVKIDSLNIKKSDEINQLKIQLKITEE